MKDYYEITVSAKLNITIVAQMPGQAFTKNWTFLEKNNKLLFFPFRQLRTS